MSVIKNSLLFVGSHGEKQLYSLFDSEANLSCINECMLSGLGAAVGIGRVRKDVVAGNNIYPEVTQAVALDFYINDVLLSDEFFVIPNLSEDVIIGSATLRKWRIKLDFEHDTVHVDPKVAKMQLK